MTSANTNFDGPSLSLSAGTWLLIGQVYIVNSGTSSRAGKAKLWDGTTIVSESRHQTEGTGTAGAYTLPVSAIVTPASTTTYKITCQSTATNDVITRSIDGNAASYLLAVKIA
jgi:hypothetical protein